MPSPPLNHADPIRRRHSPVSVIQAALGFCYKGTTLFITSAVTQRQCFDGNFSLQGHAESGYRERPACRLLCHRELLRLSCSQGMCAAHTGLKAMFHLPWSSRQGQCSGFPGRRLSSPPMPPLRCCGPNSAPARRSPMSCDSTVVFGLNEMWWDSLLSCDAAVEGHRLCRGQWRGG